MAYNFQDIDPESMDPQQLTDEQRKRRLALMASLATGGASGSFTDNLGQYATQRVNQATDKIEQIGEALKPAEPTQPAQPQTPVAQTMPPAQPEVAQPVQPQMPVAQPVQAQQTKEQEAVTPVTPEQVQQTQLPQPGPAVQVAGTQPGAGIAEAAKAQPMPSETPDWHDKLVTGNFNSLSQIVANPNTPEDVKNEAQDRLYNILNDQRLEAQANKTIQKAVTGDPRAVSDLTKELTKRSTEGSILKAMLYSRLGLNELAKDEQQKLGAGTTYQAVVGPNNTRALIKYGSDNMPISGFDENGKLISQESLAKFAANALPTKSHLMPSVHGSPVVNSQGEVGTLMYDPRSQESYVQVGNQRRATTGWTTMAQNPEAVSAAAAAKKGAELKTEGYTPSGPGATGGFSDPSIRVISGARTSTEQQKLYDQSVANGTPGVLPNGNPVAKPGTSQHEGQGALDIDSKTLTRSGRQELASKGYYQPIPNDPNHWELIPGFKPQVAATPTVGQQKIAEKVAGERTQSFNKILDEEVRPQAQAGDTISSIRKQQFQIFNRPGVDASKIFGIANGAGQQPGDQRWTMFRDILLGKVSASDDQIRERAAALGLNRDEQAALADYNNLNATVNAQTLKSTAGAGSVSDAEQRANRERNVDPTKMPALAAYNGMAQSQFNGDMARYKADWAQTSPAANALQLDKDWRKESQRLTQVYTDMAKKRLDYIVQNGSTAAAVKEGYRRFPVPEYDPQTESWKKTKPLGEILGR